jgi:hypothetical protein
MRTKLWEMEMFTKVAVNFIDPDGWRDQTLYMRLNYSRSGSKLTDMLHLLYRLIFCLNTLGKRADI